MNHTKISRNSNIEFLRIISMLFITLHHFSLWAQGPRSDTLIASNRLLDAFYSLFYLPLGDIGVYTFVMITGFYLGQREFNGKKALIKTFDIYKQLYFYCLLFVLIGLFTHINLQDNGNIYKTFLPFSFNHYWFVTAYILLIMVSPFVNRSIRNIDIKGFIYLIVVLIVSCSIFPLWNNNIASESVVLGILLTSYIVGAFIRKIIIKDKTKSKIIGIIMFLFNLLIIYGKMYYDIMVKRNRYTNIYTGFFALMSAIGLFLLFISIKPRHNKVINHIASHVFSVYLITENVYVIPRLWEYFDLSNVNSLVRVNVYGLMVVLVIMVTCCFIDVFRKEIFIIISTIFHKLHDFRQRKTNAM